jgi:hypothetical protein
MDSLRATKLANKLAAAFPGRNLQAINVRAWATDLADLDEDTATAVVGKLIHRMVDPPSLAQIRQCVHEVRGVTASPPQLYDQGDEQMTFSEFLERNPNMRKRVDAMYAKSKNKRDGVLGAALKHLEETEPRKDLA